MNIINKKRKRVCLMMRYYLYRLHLGVVDYAHEAGWILDSSMCLAGNIPQHWHGDGIISFHCDDDLIISKIKAENVPTVDLGNRPAKLQLPNVIHDNVAIGRMAGEYLVGLGLQDIAYVNINRNINDRERETGLKDVVTAKKRNFYSLDLQKLHQLENLPRPIGLMAQNDDIALQVMDYCLRRGWRIPEDIALIGADDDDLQCRLAEVPLSSVDDNVYGCGYEAAKLLDRLMDGGDPPGEAILVQPRNVVVRRSTDIIAVKHDPTANALKYIQENFADSKLGPEEVAENSGMCRRRLDDFFKEYVGRTLTQEIKKRRLDKACELLAETDYKMYVVAYQSGFSSPERLAKVFAREMGCSPNEYRQINRHIQ